MRIALDAMGGDFAPVNPVAGVVQALREYGDFTVILVGDEEKVRAEVAKQNISGLEGRISYHHASQVVDMKDSGIESVRGKKDSSVSRAVDLIKEGKADAVVSAGNTGALVAAATIKLRTLPGIHRPGLAVVIPTPTKGFLLLDAGANIDPAPEHIVGYAIMGSIYVREILGRTNPQVGLMSIGTEAGKGNEFTKECFELLSKTPVNFTGNTEGFALFSNPLDVVVCDGFVGNVILKTVEGLAKSLFTWLKGELKSSAIRMLGAWLARGAFLSIRKQISADEYGGSPLLGVNGVCIKAHGNSSPVAIKNAVRVARNFVAQKVNARIVEAIESINEKIAEH
ncbi:MAG: phosphate acyltransferase PlsX [Verrucomicrobiota bacterium]